MFLVMVGVLVTGYRCTSMYGCGTKVVLSLCVHLFVMYYLYLVVSVGQ